MKRSRQNKDLRLRGKPRKKLHSNDALTGTKTWNKKPSGTRKNREPTPRLKAAYRAPRIRAKLNLVILSSVTN